MKKKSFRRRMLFAFAFFSLIFTSMFINLFTTNRLILEKKKEEALLTKELANLNDSSLKLNEHVDKLLNSEYMLKYARDKLGVSNNNEIIFKFNEGSSGND